MKKWSRIQALALALVLALQLFAPAARAAEPGGHWAQAEIDSLKEKNIVSGDANGDFRPDDSITRAEFIKIINKTFGYSQTGEAKFSDVKENDWFSKEVAIAANAGYISGYPDGTMRPNAPITRQEAAKIVSTVFYLEQMGNSMQFADQKEVADWAAPYVAAMRDNHIMAGYPDQTFRPGSQITRAETVKLISNASGSIYNESGEISKNTSGNVVISKAGVALKDMVVEGNLYITDGCVEGSVLLDNVTVKGKIIVIGAGEKTVTMNQSTLQNVIVKKTADKAKIVLGDQTTASNLTLEGKAQVEVQKGATITKLEVKAEGSAISGEGTVQTIVAEKSVTVNNAAVEAGQQTTLNPSTNAGTGSASPGGAVGGGGGFGGGGGGSVTPSSEYKLSAALAQYRYDINGLNTLSGEVKRAGKGVANIAITVRMFDSSKVEIPIVIDELKTDDSGRFSYDFSMPVGTEAGKYTIRIYANDPVDQTVEHSFEVTGTLTVDKSKLTAQLNRAKEYEGKEGEYTSTSWKTFHDALVAAQAVQEKANPTQKEADDAAEALSAAIQGLTLKADKTALQAKLAEAKALKAADYTADSFARLTDAIASAEELLAGEPSAEALNAALTDLQEAMDALKLAGTLTAYFSLNGGTEPVTQYRAILDEYVFPSNHDTLAWVTEGPAAEDISVAVSFDSEEYMTNNTEVSDKKNVNLSGIPMTTGSTTITATTTWGGKTASAELLVTVVKQKTVTDLSHALETAGKLTAAGYTAESWAPFETARNNAKRVYEAQNSTEEQLTQALEQLNTARTGLESQQESKINVKFVKNKEDANGLTEYTFQQDYQESFYVVSDTEAENVRDIIITGDQTGDFVIQKGYSENMNAAVYMVRVMNAGDHTLTIRVEFADGLSKTITVQCHVVPKLDKSALTTAITKAKALVGDQYTPESWAAVAAALDKAEKLNAAGNLATQDAIDKAAQELNAAIDALQPKEIDKTNLELVWYQGAFDSTTPVPDAVTANVGDSIPSGGSYWLNVKGLQKGQVKSAEVVFDSDSVGLGASSVGSENQEPYVYRWKFWCKIKAAGTSTITGKVTLIDGTVHEKSFTVTGIAPVDKKGLVAQITAAEKVNQADYEASKWTALQQALGNAKAINEKADATQQQVDEAANALKDAIADKGNVAVDKSALQALVTQANDLIQSDYTTGTWKTFATKLTAAQGVLDHTGAAQSEVDAAKTELETAMGALKVDMGNIEEIINNVGTLKEGNYTSESWGNLQSAIESARKISADASAHERKTAWNQLITAMASLKWNDIDSCVKMTKEMNGLSITEASRTLTIMDMYGMMEMGLDPWVQELNEKLGANSHFRVFVGGFASIGSFSNTMPKPEDGNFLNVTFKEISKAEFNEALIRQGETVVIEAYSDSSGTFAERLTTRLPVKDGIDRTILHSQIDDAKTRKAESYTQESYAAMLEALAQAESVLTDPASTQTDINREASALAGALKALVPDSSTVDPDAKDIGLVYLGDPEQSSCYFSITKDPGEYEDAFFQVVFGENGEYKSYGPGEEYEPGEYIKEPEFSYGPGQAWIEDSLDSIAKAWIESNSVTIVLWTEDGAPYTGDDGEQITFKVNCTIG